MSSVPGEIICESLDAALVVEAKRLSRILQWHTVAVERCPRSALVLVKITKALVSREEVAS